MWVPDTHPPSAVPRKFAGTCQRGSAQRGHRRSQAVDMATKPDQEAPEMLSSAALSVRTIQPLRLTRPAAPVRRRSAEALLLARLNDEGAL